MTEPPANLTEALTMLQARLPRIKKESTGQFGKYADLADVSLKLLPIMADLGLSFSSKPTLIARENGEREFVLLYTLRHAPSGEQDQGEYPLSQSGFPQQLGSAITYARRYALTAITGAVADSDDDAEAAQDAARDRAPIPRQRRIERTRGTEVDEWSSVDRNGERRPAAKLPAAEQRDPQVGWILAEFRRLKFKDEERAQRLAITAHFAGFDGDLATTSELSKEQGKAVLVALGKAADRFQLEARYEAERAQALAEAGDDGA